VGGRGVGGGDIWIDRVVTDDPNEPEIRKAIAESWTAFLDRLEREGWRADELRRMRPQIRSIMNGTDNQAWRDSTGTILRPSECIACRLSLTHQVCTPCWLTLFDLAVTRLEHFAYLSTSTERDGEFGEKEVQRVREYTLAVMTEDGSEPRRVVRYVVWKLGKNARGEEEWVIETDGTMDISRIPLATAYAERTGFMVSDPPLLDLALENIGHYQVRSDRRNSLHIAGVPIPVTIGLREGEAMPVGSSFGINLPVGGDAKYLEPNGASLSEMREELRDIEQRMAALGLAMLQRDTRAAETAEARRIEKSETDSSLSTAARLLAAAATEALSYHAEWLDLDAGGTCAVNRDFDAQLLDPAMIRELRAMVADGQLSLETLWEMLEKGEILPESFDAEIERDRLENSPDLARRAAQTGDEPPVPGNRGNPPRRQPQPA